MVYTKARLEHALRAFRETSSHLCKEGLPSENLERHLRSKYAFRQSSKYATLANVTLWQEKSNGSDDEDYDPEKEKKRLKPRRKKAEQKRKAEDSGDQEKPVKRSKGEKEEDHRAYISFTLTSDKGRKLLRDLSRVHRTDLASFEKERSEEVEPSWWKRYSSSYGGTSVRDMSKPGVLLDDDVSERDTDDDFGSDKLVLATSLRSGKVRARPRGSKELEANTHGVAKQDQHVTNVSKISRPHLDGVHNPGQQPTFDGSSGSIRRIDSISDQVELDYRSSGEVEQAPSVLHPIDSKHNVNKHPTAKIENQPRVPAASLSEDLSSAQAQSFLDQPGLITIKTAYAHPIDFRFMPPVGQRCDFCSDWRMGILGHGKRVIQVFIDPDQPTQFQEMGNGHRSLGKPCTKMCISCALDRLLIVRCHCVDQPGCSSGYYSLSRDSQIAPAFAPIAGASFNQHNLTLYAARLIPKPGTPEASASPSRHGPLTPCSLCPQPASWQCSKWQKTDKTKKPCRIPGLDSATLATNAVISFSSSPLTPPATPSSTTATSAGPLAGHKKRPSIITISSDSDDGDFPPRPPPKPAGQTVSSRSTSHRAPSTTTTTRSPTSSSRPPQQTLRPPLKGCGLKLCTPCKTFVERRCGGLLDKKQISKWLRDESRVKTGRADVEWLFEGSCLERAYEKRIR